MGNDLIVPTRMETGSSIVKIGKWQWHYYRYRAEVIKGLLGRIDGPAQQRRALRGLLKSLPRGSPRCDVTWLTCAIAYITRSSDQDPWSYKLERQAITLLLNAGITPPKSTLSAVFADLFLARFASISGHDRLLHYQLLAAYCHRSISIQQTPLLQPTGPRVKPSRQASTNQLRQIRRLRLSGQLREAQSLCHTSTYSAALGEGLLLQVQRQGGVVTLSDKEIRQLTQQQCAELHLLTMAVKKRRWVMDLLPVPCPPDIVPLHKHLLGFYQFEAPLIARLYDYVDFKRTHPIENMLYRLYVSAGCLRWIPCGFAPLVTASFAVTRGYYSGIITLALLFHISWRADKKQLIFQIVKHQPVTVKTG